MSKIKIATGPCVLKINPYVVSSKNALDLMARICSAEPSLNRVKWLTEIKKIFAELNFRDSVKSNREFLLNPTFDKVLGDAINRLIFAMEHEPFGNRPRVCIAVTGLYNAGKSTLLNYLTQQKGLLPENSNPTTVVPAYLYCRKDIEEVHIWGVNQSRAFIQLDKSAINGIEHKNEQGNDGAIQKGASEQIATALRYFIVETPHESFENIVFIDTPGFENVGSRDNLIAKECIESADMMAYLVDCRRGSLKKEELAYLNDYSEHNKKPIVVIITRNDLVRGREEAEEIFDFIKEQVSSIPFVNDVICMSAKYNIDYWSRSGLSFEDSLKKATESAECTTNIDKCWQEINGLFEKEILHIEELVTEFQNKRTEVFNSKVELDKEQNHYLGKIPTDVENALKTNSVLCDDNTLDRLRTLTKYYNLYFDEAGNTHERIIGLLDGKIKQADKFKSLLTNTFENLLWWKFDTIGQLNSVKYVTGGKWDSQIFHSAFDAVKDLSDTNLNSLIEILNEGYDVSTKYNRDGFSILTYSAYCGNLPALTFLLNQIRNDKHYGKKFLFVPDGRGRNIMHAAAEGLQLNVLHFLKREYSDYISLKDSQERTCDDILREAINLKLKAICINN